MHPSDLPATTKVVLEVDRSPRGGYQISISGLDDNGGGSGYRLYGPKYLGDSENLITVALNERDADEIRYYLDKVFPPRSTDDGGAARQQV